MPAHAGMGTRWYLTRGLSEEGDARIAFLHR